MSSPCSDLTKLIPFAHVLRVLSWTSLIVSQLFDLTVTGMRLNVRALFNFHYIEETTNGN